MQRRSLSDILSAAQHFQLLQAWDAVEAAKDFAPLPAGDYVAHIIAGEFITSRSNNTPGYKLTFQVCEGEYQGRRFWHDIWLSAAALPLAKRDLGKLGVRSLDQLERPLPPGIRCRVSLALRRSDDGTAYNRVKRFDVIAIDQVADEADPFSPDDLPPGDGAGGATGEGAGAAASADDAASEFPEDDDAIYI